MQHGVARHPELLRQLARGRQAAAGLARQQPGLELGMQLLAQRAGAAVQLQAHHLEGPGLRFGSMFLLTLGSLLGQ